MSTPPSSNPLFGEAVRSALSELEGLERPPEPLRVVERLRATLPADVAREAATLFALRLRARGKLPRHPPPYLTRKGLEQASAEPVADERARLVAERAPGATVLDATCGIGADALAVARRGLPLVAADRELFHAQCARANLTDAMDAARAAAHVVVADAERPCARADVLLLDPDRRAEGARTLDPARWSPTLERSLELAGRFAGACLKLAPALDAGKLDLAAHPRATLRWVSLAGELAECALWTGALGDERTASGAAPREAVLLDGRGGAATLRGEPRELAPCSEREAAEPAWLAEPDPAVIRARLVGTLARDQGLRPLAARIAYLAGEAPPRSPFLRAWRVLGSAPADARRVRELLGAHDVGPVTVKKRGHPDDATTLAARFRGPGSRPGLLAVARLERGHRVYLLDAG